MSRVESIEEQIAALDQSELKTLREWFAQHDAEMWDRQIEADAGTGKLDRMAESALADHKAGLTTDL
ncbi:MAG: hypothetical protein HYX27_17190 [Acidobacteria bacterium]|nr:hypothetical protein [Acidobacteriota bacterium]